MRRRLYALIALSLAGSGALACGGSSETPTAPTETPTEATPAALHHGLTEAQARETLAKIGTRTITVGEFAEAIAAKGPFLQARYNSPERRRELLDQMVRFELLAQEAEREGFDERPEVQRTRNQVLIRRFLKQHYEDRIQLTDIRDEEVRQYYDAHRSEFDKPEQVRASHILVHSRATAQRVLRQILDNPTDVRLFRELSERHNEDPATRDRFGDLRFFSRPEQRQSDEPEVAAAVATAAFSITTIGGVHPELVETPEGFHIVKLTGRRAALSRSLEDASRPIRHRLWRERREQAVEDLVGRLRSEADVHEDLSLLSEVHIDLPAGAFPTEMPLPSAGELTVPPAATSVPAPAPTAPSPAATGAPRRPPASGSTPPATGTAGAPR
jgi:peptidyl-prolyl cis-trans isomerase C